LCFFTRMALFFCFSMFYKLVHAASCVLNKKYQFLYTVVQERLQFATPRFLFDYPATDARLKCLYEGRRIPNDAQKPQTYVKVFLYFLCPQVHKFVESLFEKCVLVCRLQILKKLSAASHSMRAATSPGMSTIHCVQKKTHTHVFFYISVENV